jgi:uncharacterized SAM-binding protein YcdF (DUF218 family)
VRPPRRWLRRLRWPLLTLLVGAALWLFRAELLEGAARFLDVSEPPRKVDYVMVLGGDYNTRPFVAAALVKTGHASAALVPTVAANPRPSAVGLSEHEILRRVMLVRGVAAESIVLLPGNATSTQEEAGALAEFLQTRPDCSVAVITNAYHTRRARMLFARVLGERMQRIHFVAAPTDGYDATNWWRTSTGTAQYLNEFFKLGYYSLGGG